MKQATVYLNVIIFARWDPADRKVDGREGSDVVWIKSSQIGTKLGDLSSPLSLVLRLSDEFR